jgi:hypothetical protein
MSADRLGSEEEIKTARAEAERLAGAAADELDDEKAEGQDAQKFVERGVANFVDVQPAAKATHGSHSPDTAPTVVEGVAEMTLPELIIGDGR